MKKLITCVLILLFLLPVAALAEEVAAEVVAEIVESELPTEPVSWQQLATIGGCALMTMLIVQLCKLPLDKVWKIPTRFVVFFISLVIMLLATYFTAGWTDPRHCLQFSMRSLRHLLRWVGMRSPSPRWRTKTNKPDRIMVKLSIIYQCFDVFCRKLGK